MKFPYPRWLETMPEGEAKERAKNRFILRLCCIYASPKGNIGHLAKMIGVNQHTLKSQVRSDPVVASEATKEGIRRVLGPEFVPQTKL